jgi:spermidine synthase
MAALGTHILVEFLGCNPEILNDASIIQIGMVAAAKNAGAMVINSTFHHFSPYGVSGVVVIQESHLAIHTWPEYEYAAVDLFTCGDTVDPWQSFDHLKSVFKAKNYSALEMKRGSLSLLKRVKFDVTGMREIAARNIDPERFKSNVWFTDKDENQALSLRYSGEKLFEKISLFQKVRVIETYAYGKALTIDNMVMCTERDEAHYHEMIAHPVMLAHPNIQTVLVIGGGDGGTVREVLKHDSVQKVVMVEIDGTVVEAAQLHLPGMSCSLNHPRLELRIEDGIQYVASLAPESYDLIIVDGSDPVGPAEGLFSKNFYTNCKTALTPNGILVTQGESPMFNASVFIELNHCLKSIYGLERVHVLLFSIATYPSGIWSFQIASKGSVNPAKVDSAKASRFENNHALQYYNQQIHAAAFALPNYVQKMIS